MKPWHTSENSATSQTLAFMGHKKGWTKTGRGKDCHWSLQGQLPEDDGQGNCCQDVWQTVDGPHYLMRGHVQFVGISSVHPGQVVTEINFKFCKGLKGIEIILAPCDIIILDKLDKTVKIDIFIKVISRDILSIIYIYMCVCVCLCTHTQLFVKKRNLLAASC